MARNRYKEIMQYLHFANNKQQPANNWMYKVQNILDNLLRKFEKYLNPHQNLCVDKSLLLFKGRLKFKQYVPSKRSRFGIKTFVLCDCSTGYILNVLPYARKQTKTKLRSAANKNLGATGTIIMTILLKRLNKGH